MNCDIVLVRCMAWCYEYIEVNSKSLKAISVNELTYITRNVFFQQLKRKDFKINLAEWYNIYPSVINSESSPRYRQLTCACVWLGSPTVCDRSLLCAVSMIIVLEDSYHNVYIFTEAVVAAADNMVKCAG